VLGKIFPRRLSDSSASSLKRWNLQVGKKRWQAVERALREVGSLWRKSMMESVSSGARSVRDMVQADMKARGEATEGLKPSESL